MKKIIIGITFLLIVIFTLSFYCYSAIINSSEKIIGRLSSLEDSTEEKKWKEAQLRAKDLKVDWEGTKTLWTPLIDHTEVDRADLLIARTIKLVELESRVKALEEIAAAKVMIQNIGDGQRPNIQNIF